MKTRLLSLSAISALFVGLFLITTSFITEENNKNPKATTGGELSFTIRTVSAGGNYAPKHVLAIWVEHEDEFVKTRKAMANQRKQYLYTWKAASNYNVIDAITGATLTSHQTHTVNWDFTDLDGDIVADGEYVIYCEFTDKHAQGPLYSLTFTKGPDAISLTPPDETYFKDIEFEFTPMVSEFIADETDICQWGTVTFTDESVNATSWEWDFGDGAAPTTANTQGPHTVYYTTSGTKSVSLTINENVTELKENYIDVTVLPTAEFSFSSSDLTVEFTNLSVNATTYLWDFGDGNTSTDNNPTHTYATGGAYTVSLTASYLSCEDMTTGLVNVPLVGIDNISSNNDINIFPNPNSGKFMIDLGNYSTVESITLLDQSGKQSTINSSDLPDEHFVSVDLNGISKGIYFIRINADKKIITKKLIIK